MAETLNHYRTITPYLVVKDADAELRFLSAVFGAKEKLCKRREDNTVMHAEIEIGDSLVMLGQASEDIKPREAAFYVMVESADKAYEKALGAGAKSERKPEDQHYGHRVAGVVDPNGNA